MMRGAAALCLALSTGCLGQCSAIGGGAVGAVTTAAGQASVCGASAYPACPGSAVCRVAAIADSQGGDDGFDVDTWSELVLEGMQAQDRSPCVTFELWYTNGGTVATVTPDWEANIEGNGYDVLITWVGGNDADIDDDEINAAIVTMNATHLTQATEGGKVINLGNWPWKDNVWGTWSAEDQVRTDTFKTAMAADGNADYLNMFDLLEDDSDQYVADAATNNGDGIHLNQAGHTAVANAILAELANP